MQENSENIREDPDNIEVYCAECSEKQYPAKGKFTRNMLKYATHIKKAFGREHMWVKITQLTGEHVVGTIDNIPVLPGSPAYETVIVKYAEIETAM